MIRLLLLSGAFLMFSTSQFISIIKLTGIFNVFVQCLEICGSRAFQVEMFIMTMHQWRTWTPIFLRPWVDVIHENTNRHQLCTTLRKSPSSSLPGPCTDFIMTQQTRQNDVAAPDSLCFVITVWRIFVAFFSPSVRLLFLFLFCCVVYWNNTALCQKEKKGVGVFRVLFIDITWSPLCFWSIHSVLMSEKS